MYNIKIHILSLKREICVLVKKTLKDKGYEVTCNGGEEINEELIKNFELRPDCIILDKDIKDELKAMVKTKFKDIFFICLPSLNSEALSDENVRYMNEPLKPSELRTAIEEIEQKILKNIK